MTAKQQEIAEAFDTTSFFRRMFQHATKGFIVLWSKRNSQTESFPISAVDTAAERIRQISQNGDVFLARSIQSLAPPKGSRGSASTVVFVGGLFLDIDTREGPHGSGNSPTDPESLPKSVDEVLHILQEEGLPPPTMVVHTGGGCHLHWMYANPEMLESDLQRNAESALSNAFQSTIRTMFAAVGYRLDATADLSHLCKAPGTLNHKTQPAKPVQLVSTGLRVDRAVMEKWTFERMPSACSTALATRPDVLSRELYSQAFAEANLRNEPANRYKLFVGCALAGCSFLRHCVEDSAHLSEPEWYTMVGIVARTEKGEFWVHQFSSNYAGYSRKETDGKIAHALKDAGPATCDFIETKLAWPGCKRCTFRKNIKSPLSLADEYLDLINVQKRAVYSIKSQCYIDIYHDDVFDVSQFDDLYRSEVGDKAHKTNTMSKVCPKVLNSDYLPGNDNLILDENPRSLGVNLWQRGGVSPVEGDPSLVLEFLDRFIPNSQSRNHVLRYLAHAIQYPSKKLTHGIILTGEPGTGKSTFNSIVCKLFGDRNARKIEGKELASNFDERLVDVQFLLIEEANHGERLETSEKLKEVITGEFYNVEKKYKSVRPGRTPRGVFLTSNHTAPLVLPAEDRRWAVFETCSKPSAAEDIAVHKEFFGRFIRSVTKDDNLIAAFAHYLLRLDLCGFDPNHEPPMTAAKIAATEGSRVPLATIINDLVMQGVAPLHKDVVTVHEIQDAINNSVWNSPGSNPQKIVNALKSLGMKQVNLGSDGKHLAVYIPDKPSIRLWAIRDVGKWSVADRDALRSEWLRGISAIFDYESEASDGILKLKSNVVMSGEG